MKFKYSFLILIIGTFISSFKRRITNKRPPIDKRKFISSDVDNFIENIISKFKNDSLAQIYENCFPNTLDTTIEYDQENDDTFVITGDIEAMWLRDSSFQVFPYLKYAKTDLKLKKMMLSLIKRQSRSIIIDPYANAFNKGEADSPWQSDDTYKLVNGKRVPAMNKKLWERKYELDSTISTLFFAYNFYLNTDDTSFISDPSWQNSLNLIINLVKNEIRGTEEEDKHGGPEYFFQRKTAESFDSLHQGRGNPVNSCGLVKSMFRNSDDATTFSYNIPENAFLVSTFENVAKMIKNIILQEYEKKNNFKTKKLELTLFSIAEELEKIAISVRESIYKNGVFTDPSSGQQYFAYEVDCFGNHYFIDDPGYPSLISLPFFGFIDNGDPLYISTRNRILSNKNPYYFTGISGEGLGSAHTSRYYIWPLFTIMRILTSNEDKEIMESIDLLIKSAQSTGFMHESFNINDPNKFTRPWFAWANSFFGFMINHVISTKPYLLIK